MPGMSGIEVTSALRKTRPDLPVVLSSGFITEDLRLAAEAAGVAEILRKPASMEELGAAIFRTLQRRP
jgi:CheY-like chemotaxis protein